MIHVEQHTESEWKEWINHPDTVYIGPKRGSNPVKNSVWYNPYLFGNTEDREVAYQNRIRHKIAKGQLDLEELRNKTLLCVCDQEVCHGKILQKMMNEPDPSSCDECGDLMAFHCSTCIRTWCSDCLLESSTHDGFTCLLSKKMS
jgi:hypothetical protein